MRHEVSAYGIPAALHIFNISRYATLARSLRSAVVFRSLDPAMSARATRPVSTAFFRRPSRAVSDSAAVVLLFTLALYAPSL